MVSARIHSRADCGGCHAQWQPEGTRFAKRRRQYPAKTNFGLELLRRSEKPEVAKEDWQ
jgi:hypothetical protein